MKELSDMTWDEMTKAQREAALKVEEHEQAIKRIMGRFRFEAQDVINDAVSFNWREQNRRRVAA